MILKQVGSTVKKCPKETVVDMYKHGHARHYKTIEQKFNGLCTPKFMRRDGMGSF